MTVHRSLRLVCCALLGAASITHAQGVPAPWRAEADGVGTTARVLIIGAHPDDEDNALLAWLSLGRHVETGYLSLTRGENGVNALVRERGSLLGMVRTAEVREERKRDGARQFFTRAYDFGFAKNDSVANAAWPRDSLLRDVVTVIRAFRPQVVITLFSGDSTDHDGQHQVAGEIARQAWSLAADTALMPSTVTARLGAWSATTLYQLVDGAPGKSVVRIDVGELDRERERSYAELGAEIRQSQRTQVAGAAPVLGPMYRMLRLDSTRTAASEQSTAVPRAFFDGVDTSWTRFSPLPASTETRAAVDSLLPTLVRPADESTDAAAARLGRIVTLSTRARSSLGCAEPAAVTCTGLRADLALSLAITRDRAARALLDASGIVIDATADRESVAVGDTVGVTVSLFNGGRSPVSVSRVTVQASVGDGFNQIPAATIPPDSVVHWTGMLRMRGVVYPWWPTGGLLGGTSMYVIKSGLRGPPLGAGETSVFTSSAQLALRVGDADIEATVAPIVARGPSALRGDDRHPVVGVPQLSVLLERSREYARAAAPLDRLERAWVGTALGRADTVDVKIKLPAGLATDSAARTVILPPYGGRNIFFRVRGTIMPGTQPFSVSATVHKTPSKDSAAAGGLRTFRTGAVDVIDGLVAFEYPHIPTQRLPVLAADSMLAVDLRVPPSLHVAFIRAGRNDQLDSRIAELGVQINAIDPAALAVADLSYYSTILVAPRAYSDIEALQANSAVLRRFAEHGGTVVVLYGREELLIPGVLPFPIAFGGSKPVTAVDPDAPIRISDPRSTLVTWPNRITPADFADWVGTRARELPTSFDARYSHVFEVLDDDHHPSGAAILATRIGKGMFIYTALSFDAQLTPAMAGGAARLLVNLLSAGQAPRP